MIQIKAVRGQSECKLVTDTGPTNADLEAKKQLDALLVYADATGQTLLAALLSEANDVQSRRLLVADGDLR